jgi:hypothetical protein
MPLTGQRSSGNNFTPIVTNNNAFSVKIVPLDGKMEEVPNKDVEKNKDTLKVGDMISGEEVKTEKKVIGKIVAIETDDNHVVGYKVLDKDGEEVIIDPSTAVKHETNDGSEVGSKSSTNTSESSIPVLKSSSLVKSFNEWTNSID